MTGLGMTLAWSMVTVTLVAATALILERVASRRGPRAGSWVSAVSLLVVIVTTPLALLPAPKLLPGRFSVSAGRPAQATSEVQSITLRTPGQMNGSGDAVLRPSATACAWRYSLVLPVVAANCRIGDGNPFNSTTATVRAEIVVPGRACGLGVRFGSPADRPLGSTWLPA